jgi:tetratricopeptide (TPR) repeat protein
MPSASRVQRMYEWDWEGAQASSARALALAPDSLDVIQEAGELASYLGRAEEAVVFAEKAITLDPLSANAYARLGRVYFSALRLQEAEAGYLKALELAPQRIVCHSILASILCRQGRLDEALAHAEREPAEFARLLALGDVNFAMGREAESRAALDKLKADHAEESAIQIAILHAIRGEVDDAFHWMNKAVDTRDSGASMVKSIPVLPALHRDPRWPVFLARMGLEP